MASTARKVANGVLSIRSMTAYLPPIEGRTLYTGQVDPYLINGCDVILDVRDDHLAWLRTVQNDFLRQILGLNEFSLLAPLFTELAIFPLPYRRIILALSYLRSLVTLPSSHYAHVALHASVSLFQRGFSSWVGDLALVLRNLPYPVILPPVLSLTQDHISGLIKSVSSAAKLDLQTQIDNSPRLSLLHDRLEPLEGTAPAYRALFVRHYLHVRIHKHRVAITCLLLGDHCLAVEQLRRHSAYFLPPVPRHLRLCRFCHSEIESPEHALLTCEGSTTLSAMRNQYIGRVNIASPGLIVLPITHNNAVHALKRLIFQRDCIDLIAKFVWDVLHLFEAEPILLPPLSLLVTSEQDNSPNDTASENGTLWGAS
ncbi:hypothetical protein ARMSODRAFT_1053743 [Armillaria solidipes]|uniref:Reverse transcriptase zinc-binding domain-containing protein n=1 Tax=Armillaria solidipes TaxID=1076256 RepID=A0A2H3B1A2_9AGAR|nr:hypothetical protein ARMSODRAFT_1053743 [Armillaria solidipes]